jgi:Mce-associated membrane protein
MATAADTSCGELTATTNGSRTDDATSSESPQKQDPATSEAADSPDKPASTDPKRRSRLVTVVAVGTVIAVAGLAGWLGLRAYQSYQAEKQRELFVGVARQVAVNLATVDWQHVDADAQRILDSSTGAFYDDFEKRMKPFVEVVKKVQSKSVGTVDEAALESQSGDQAEVLVAMYVKVSTSSDPDQPRRAWRMRVSVQEVGDGAKVSNVAFVP